MRRSILHSAYTWCILLLAFWLLSYVLPEVNLDLGRELLIIAGLAVLAEWFTVTFPQGRLSGGFAVVLSSFIIFGPAAAAWISGLSTLVGQGIVNRGNPIRTTVFNASQYVLAVLGAGYIYTLAGGVFDSRLTSGNLLPLMTFIVTYFVINQALVYLYLLPLLRHYPLLEWRDAIRWDALTYLFAIPLGILMVLVYVKLGVFGLILMFLPLLATQFVLRLYVNLDMANRELRALYEMARGLGRNLSVKEILDLLLRESRRVVYFHTGIVYLWSLEDQAYVAHAIKGPYEKSLLGSQIEPGVGLVGRALASCQTEFIYDSRVDLQLKDEHGLVQLHRSLIVIPLLSENQAIGGLVLGDKRQNAFKEESLRTLSIMCNQAALKVESLKSKVESQDESQKPKEEI